MQLKNHLGIMVIFLWYKLCCKLSDEKVITETIRICKDRKPQIVYEL